MTSSPVHTDLDRLRAQLVPVEEEARELPWADERPWRIRSHVRVERDLVLVDLHDLNARCARRAVRQVTAVGDDLERGAVTFVVGVGSHSIGPGVLGDVVARELRKLAPKKGWSYHPAGKGALVLVTDAAKAPPQATSGLGPFFWLIAAVFCTALVVAFPVALVPIAVVAALVLWRWWRRRG